jgi:hypothetical protein
MSHVAIGLDQLLQSRRTGNAGAQKRRACGGLGPGKLFFSLFNLWSTLRSSESEIPDIDMYRNLSSVSADRHQRTASLGTFCAGLIERAGVEINTDFMVVEKVYFLTAKGTCGAEVERRIIVDCQVSSRVMMRVEAGTTLERAEPFKRQGIVCLIACKRESHTSHSKCDLNHFFASYFWNHLRDLGQMNIGRRRNKAGAPGIAWQTGPQQRTILVEAMPLVAFRVSTTICDWSTMAW